ncbi:MAG: phosphotransferase [Dehalococcoidia bacterium]
MIAAVPREVEAPSALLAGRYALGATIAIGGGATVRRAWDVRLARTVAVKRAHGPRAHAALRREAALLARCSHPGVVTCLDAGEDASGAPYLVLRLVEGVNLAQHGATKAPARAVARRWAREAIGAVAHLHARGIAHGDLKLQHVVIERDGHAVLVDLDHAVEATPEAVMGDRRALARLVRGLLARSTGHA